MKGKATASAALPVAMLLVSLLISGSNGIVSDGVMLSSSQIVFFRMLIGATILVLACIATKMPLDVLRNRHDMLFLIGGGAAMACELLFLYEAYRFTGVAMATILCYLAPIVVMILSPIIFHNHLTLPKGVSFAVVVLGCFLVNMTALGKGASVAGIMCGLGAACGMSAMVILNKKVGDVAGMQRALVQMLSAALTCAVYVGATEGIVETFSTACSCHAWTMLAAIGILGGVSNLLYFSAIGKLSVQSVAVFGYLEPLSAVLMGVFILGEQMAAIQIVGAVLIACGALASETICSEKRSGHHREAAAAECPAA